MTVRNRVWANLADGRKKFAPLIDPDKYTAEEIVQIALISKEAGADFLFFGGSLVLNHNHRDYVSILKDNCPAPVVLFPGSQLMISDHADALLLLSLISGRNAEMLIGKHVAAAPYLKDRPFEIVPTGYMLIESGHLTAVNYMSSTMPIPRGSIDIAVSTAMAGEMLGLKLLYLDAGSGAAEPVGAEMIRKVKENVSIPVIVGGGICTPQQALTAATAGADLIVIGNAIEKDRSLIRSVSEAVHALNGA